MKLEQIAPYGMAAFCAACSSIGIGTELGMASIVILAPAALALMIVGIAEGGRS